MPILDVQVIGSVPEEIRRGLAQQIADGAAAVFDSGPEETWVKLHFIPADEYAENAGGPPPGVQSVIVSILHSGPPSLSALADQAVGLTRAIGDACQRRPEHIHLVYEPPGKGRVVFGGNIVG